MPTDTSKGRSSPSRPTRRPPTCAGGARPPGDWPRVARAFLPFGPLTERMAGWTAQLRVTLLLVTGSALGLAASYLPARKAARTDLLRTLERA